MSVVQTKLALKAIVDVAIVSADVLKDGFQVADLVKGFQELEGDAQKKADLEAALANLKAIPDELSALSLADGIDLAISVIQMLPDLIAAFKAPAAPAPSADASVKA